MAKAFSYYSVARFHFAIIPLNQPNALYLTRFMSAAFHQWRARLRGRLDRVPLLRTAIFIASDLKNHSSDQPHRIQSLMNALYVSRADPFAFARDVEQCRFATAEQILTDAAGGRRFLNAFEIGCAEGLFTLRLAPLCVSLLAADVSSVALRRASQRCRHLQNVEFKHWELHTPVPGGGYDLVVATGVLEFLRRPPSFERVRDALADSLAPGGHLLVGTTLQESVEGSWWARRMIRGSQINRFIGEHPRLATVCSVRGQFGLPFLHTLFRKTA